MCMAKMGRPKKAAKDKKTDGFWVCLSPTERKKITVVRQTTGLDESTWAREVLLKEVLRVSRRDKLGTSGGVE